MNEKIRLRYICTIETGDHDTQDAEKDGIYPFYVRSPIIEKSNTSTFNGPGILIAGDGAGAGRIFHNVEGEYAVHQRVYRLANFSSKVNKDFLFYSLDVPIFRYLPDPFHTRVFHFPAHANTPFRASSISGSNA